MPSEDDAEVRLAGRVEQGKKDLQSYGMTQVKVHSFQRFEKRNDRGRDHRRSHSQFYLDKDRYGTRLEGGLTYGGENNLPLFRKGHRVRHKG